MNQQGGIPSNPPGRVVFTEGALRGCRPQLRPPYLHTVGPFRRITLAPVRKTLGHNWT